jgi:hypothetical protein
MNFSVATAPQALSIATSMRCRIFQVLPQLARAPRSQPYSRVSGASVPRSGVVAWYYPEPLYGSAVSLRQDPSAPLSAGRDSSSQAPQEVAERAQSRGSSVALSSCTCHTAREDHASGPPNEVLKVPRSRTDGCPKPFGQHTPLNQKACP